MENYAYLAIGIVMGIAISVYVVSSMNEKARKEIETNRRIFSSKLVESALDRAVDQIEMLISQNKRELSEDEKNEIIFDCLSKEKQKQMTAEK